MLIRSRFCFSSNGYQLIPFSCVLTTGALRSYSSSSPLLVGSVGKVTQVIGAVVDVQFSVSIKLQLIFHRVILFVDAVVSNTRFALIKGKTPKNSKCARG
jgi:hypothetical protein